MDKYGVDTTKPPGEKTAEDKTALKPECPKCGAVLDPESPVPRCPWHGTEPFEKKEK